VTGLGAALTIRPLDPANDAQMAAWHAAYLAAEVQGRDYASPWMLPELRADFLGERASMTTLPFSGLVAEPAGGAATVTAGVLWLPQHDNRHQASVQVHTHPDHQHRGYGSAMLAHLIGVAREHGRRTITADASYPYDGPADGAGHPVVRFLTRRGFSLALGDVTRVLALPVDFARLDRLAAQAAPYHRDYTLRRFAGRVPDDIIVGFGQLIGSLMTEAPVGELEVEPEVFTPERIRADEEVFAASGRTKYTTVALAAGGAVAGYSEIVVPRHDPGRAYQWGTLVRRAHRGHRLGLATKAHNLAWVQREEPELRLLVTFNAEVNAHMIGVNEQLGFRPVERLGEFQQQLG
jgi:GNAT superfamily N-acetyltransferase